MRSAITRRKWLRLSAGALLSLGVWPGRLRGADAPAHDDFTFIAVNDLHALEAALERGLKDVEAGRVRPVEEVKTMLPRWTSKS